MADLDDIDLHGAAALRLETDEVKVEFRPDGVTVTFCEKGRARHQAGIRRQDGRWTLYQQTERDGVIYDSTPDPEAAARLVELATEWQNA